MNRLLPFAAVALSSLVACEPFIEPQAPIGDPACGEAPATFDPAGDVVYAAGIDGCVRIERRLLDDGSFAPIRLVAHVQGFSGRIDVDTDALTYEGQPDGTAIVTSDDVTAAIVIDVCTGEWAIEIDEGEAVLPVLGQ